MCKQLYGRWADCGGISNVIWVTGEFFPTGTMAQQTALLWATVTMTGVELVAVDEPVTAVVWELPQRDQGGILPEWDDLIDQVAGVRRTGASQP